MAKRQSIVWRLLNNNIRPLHLPFHNYLGPGSDLNAGRAPVDTDDAIAYDHDTNYAAARNEEDIRTADRIAIRDFAAIGGSHGLIGAAGLAAKYAFESVAGVKYGMPSVKRPRDGDPQDSPVESQEEAPPTDQASDTNSNPGMPSGSGQPGSSTTGGVGETGCPGAPVLIGSGHNPAAKYIFTKKFQICTGSSVFKYGQIPESYRTAFMDGDRMGMTATPLAVIDPNHLPWFMTRKEYHELPNYSFATRCQIKVRPLGYRLPFNTNSSHTDSANSQCLIQIAWATGLNHKFPCIHSSVAYDTDHVTPVNLTNDYSIESTLYKFHGATLGVPRLLNYNVHILQNNYKTGSDTTSNYAPHLLKCMTVANIVDVRGTHVHNFEYKYKVAPLKLSFSSIIATTSGVNTSDLSQEVFIARRTRFDKKLPNVVLLDSEQQFIANRARDDSLFLTYEHILEKSAFLRVDPTMGHTSDLAPPAVYFGCMPVQSNSPYAATASFSAAVVFWEIETSLEVTVMTDFTSSNDQCGPWQFQYNPRVIRELDTNYGYMQYSLPSYFINGRRFYRNNRLHPAVNDNAETIVITDTTLPVKERPIRNVAVEEDEEVQAKSNDPILTHYEGPITRSQTRTMEVDTDHIEPTEIPDVQRAPRKKKLLF